MHNTKNPNIKKEVKTFTHKVTRNPVLSHKANKNMQSKIVYLFIMMSNLCSKTGAISQIKNAFDKL